MAQHIALSKMHIREEINKCYIDIQVIYVLFYNYYYYYWCTLHVQNNAHSIKIKVFLVILSASNERK